MASFPLSSLGSLRSPASSSYPLLQVEPPSSSSLSTLMNSRAASRKRPRNEGGGGDEYQDERKEDTESGGGRLKIPHVDISSLPFSQLSIEQPQSSSSSSSSLLPTFAEFPTTFPAELLESFRERDPLNGRHLLLYANPDDERQALQELRDAAAERESTANRRVNPYLPPLPPLRTLTLVPSSRPLITLEQAYPDAKYYPEIVSGTKDLDKFLAASAFQRHGDWMLNYSPRLKHFLLKLPNDAVRLIANDPLEVVNLIGANNSISYDSGDFDSELPFLGSEFIDQIRSTPVRPLLIHSLQDHTPQYLPPSEGGTRQGALQPPSLFRQQLAQFFGETLPEDAKLYIPRGIVDLIAASESRCDVLTDYGRKCLSGGNRFIFQADTKHEGEGTDIEHVVEHVHCPQTCVEDYCPAWVSAFVTQLPATAIMPTVETYGSRGGTYDKTDISLYEASNWLLQITTFTLSQRPSYYSIFFKKVSPGYWVRQISTTGNYVGQFGTQMFTDDQVITQICEFVNLGKNYNSRFTIITTFDAEEKEVLKSLLDEELADFKPEYFTAAGQPCEQFRSGIIIDSPTIVSPEVLRTNVSRSFGLDPYRE